MAAPPSCFILLFCFCSLAARLLFILPISAAVYSNCLRNATLNNAGTFTDSLTWALGNLTDLADAGFKYAVASANSASLCLSISQNLSSYGPSCDSASISASSVADTAYAMFQCRGDQSLDDCSTCVGNAMDTLLHSLCPSSVGARIQLDACYVHYDNQTFFTPDFDVVLTICSVDKTSDPVALSAIDSLVSNVTAQAPKNGGYASKSASSEYALAQCLGFLNEADCLECLTSYSYRQACDTELGGQIHLATCYYRFDPYSFFTASAPPPPALEVPPSSSSQEDNDSSQPLFKPKAEVFSLHDLELATEHFHSNNKLGEGGFGLVYKGTLQNGQQIAVKKLAVGSQQGRREFMNEVHLITTVQHKNLIKLLGSCIEGPERILVYEYLPNGSVDGILFGDASKATLDWHTRHGIILGMARGLAYLHEESQVRIIHRDIKPSNILLDDHLNPVIGDFGLARLVLDDESHINTRVAGTIGYLAPEYMFSGELTEKVDVFSFGVVTLEMITGKKNSSDKILEQIWTLYQSRREMELVDPKLGTSFAIEEVIRAIHIALLCVQEIPNLRPNMSSVLLLLTGNSTIVDVPTKPAFVGLNPKRAESSSSAYSARSSELS